MTRIGTIALALATTLALVACDPKTPVQTSDITTQMDQKIAAHNADATAHANLQITSGQLTDQIPTGKIADAAITAAKLANGSVGSTQLAPGAVTAPAIGAGAVQTAAIGDLMVTAAKIANGSITTSQISATAGITGTQLAAGANIAGTQLAANANIAGTQLANNSVTATQIAAATITANEIANATITGGKLAANTITAGQIAANTITATQIAAATITGNEIAAGTISDANAGLSSIGTGNNTAATAFYTFQTDNSNTWNTATINVTFGCYAKTAAMDGTIDVFDGATVQGTAVTCTGGQTSGFLQKITFSSAKNKTYTVRYKAAAAGSPVFWRNVNVTF